MRSWLRRPLGRVLVAAAVALSGGGIYLAVDGGSPPGDDVANLWVNTTAGDSPSRCSTTCVYDSTNAYGSIQAAIAACTAGDTIRMQAGSYGDQTITTDRSAPGCTVIAEDGTSIGDLATQGNWFELRNVDASGWDLGQAGTTNVTLRDFNVSSGAIWLNAEGYSNVSWLGGSFHDFSCSACSQGMAVWAGETAGGSSVASNVVIDGVTFDNIDNTGGVGNHFEVIRVDGKVQGFTLRNSTFINSTASTSLIFFTTFRGTKPDDITLENNFFGDPVQAFVTINENYQGSSCTNWTVRYNTFQEPHAADGNCSYTNVVWTGNLAPAGNGCPGSSFIDNVWFGTGSTCHASDLVIGSSGLGGDGFHLQAGSGAIDNGGTGANCIATDHDGGPRPVGARCDAGADERD